MPLDELSREKIEDFRTYIEDSVATDDRYGPAQRHDQEDESTLAMRFEAGPSCWFEVVVRPMIPQIRVGFVTDDPMISEEIEQAIQESGGSMEQFVGLGFGEAGLDWGDPPVEHFDEGGEHFYFATALELDEVPDVDLTEIRNKTLRMLEGYLIAFGPAIVVEEE
ncbi:MAG: hypothetical protein JSU86_12835 [Phycisphaerales bacterium]|nr:MAG: hypothetical protein JSU86_12835 [Phycisphaerales bacterium]